MSLGVNLLAALVEQAAKALPSDAFDIEVLEMHHKHKVDAPSGTALLLGDAAARGRDINLAENSVRTRDGITGARDDGTIGFATLRGGSVIGEHTVILAGNGERIELSHSAQDRSLFATGAITGRTVGPWKTAWTLFHARCTGTIENTKSFSEFNYGKNPCPGPSRTERMEPQKSVYWLA